jgi:hypothetical protein
MDLVAGPRSAYCGRCGTPFGTTGSFCRRCGAPRGALAPAAPNLAPAAGWSYPVVPATTVPGARHKRRAVAVVLSTTVLLAVPVAVITAVAVRQKPVTYCPFSCGTQVGPRLLAQMAYQSSQFGYRVEYRSPFTIANDTAADVEIYANEDNFITFAGVAGKNVNAAMQHALSSLSSSEFQDLHASGAAVNGAEIGYVAATGEAYSGTFVGSGANVTQPISVVVMAANQGNLTLSVAVVGTQDTSSYELMPLGLEYGGYLDFEVSNTVWPGGT